MDCILFSRAAKIFGTGGYNEREGINHKQREARAKEKLGRWSTHWRARKKI
jgi:hypothetical protein